MVTDHDTDAEATAIERVEKALNLFRRLAPAALIALEETDTVRHIHHICRIET